MLSFGIHNVEPIKITLREGVTNQEIVDILNSKLKSFHKELFLNKAKDKQGYLFPDTYFFYPLTTTDEIFNTLSDNFIRRTKILNSEINQSGKKLSDIVTMASIVEKESHGKDDAQLISGVLWHRIRVGMPLQVDVDKSTYTAVGLPSHPISNPGLFSIEASLRPIDSSYLYYLHDKNGVVHFAVTFAEHKKNINRYLK